MSIAVALVQIVALGSSPKATMESAKDPDFKERHRPFFLSQSYSDLIRVSMSIAVALVSVWALGSSPRATVEGL